MLQRFKSSPILHLHTYTDTQCTSGLRGVLRRRPLQANIDTPVPFHALIFTAGLQLSSHWLRKLSGPLLFQSPRENLEALLVSRLLGRGCSLSFESLIAGFRSLYLQPVLEVLWLSAGPMPDAPLSKSANGTIL